MFKGIYNGAAALNVIAQQQEQISNNLANLNTAGFRSAQLAVDQRDSPNRFGLFDDLGPRVSERTLNFGPGRQEPTGRPLDLAIAGDAFFALTSPNGTVYTRVGQFFRDLNSGNLVSQDGFEVQGADGPINLPENVGDRQLAIAEDGSLSADGTLIGQVRLVAFEDNQALEPLTQSIFRANEDTVERDPTASILQYHRELSNGHAVSELVTMISGLRQYEAVQKATSQLSESLREHIRA